jgi:AcrR family transcriptional regulator
MGRKEHFKRDEFMDAALKMVAQGGPGALTVSALAIGMKAPIGSVYHRFQSRDALLAELWIRAVEQFQRGFLEALARNGLLASLYTVEWVRKHPNEGRLLLLYRREELLSGDWPEHLKEDVARLSRELDSGIRSFAEKRLGSLTEETLRRATFALVDVPLAAVRQHLQEGKPPPDIVDELIRATYLAIIRGDK